MRPLGTVVVLLVLLLSISALQCSLVAQTKPAPATKPELVLQTGHTLLVVSVAFSPDGRWLASGSADGSARIWNVASGEQLAMLVSMSGTPDWLVVTPDGLFDGSPGASNQILWRFNNNTFDVAPVEAFFSEDYHPGLLADILAGKRPKARISIEKQRSATAGRSVDDGQRSQSGRKAGRRTKLESEANFERGRSGCAT